MLRVIFAAALTLGLAGHANADEAQLRVVRQLASAGVYMHYCPAVRSGPGLVAMATSAGITLSDMDEGGRFRNVAISHAAELKSVMHLAKSDNPGVACRKGLDLYGPTGAVARNVLVPR